MVYYTLDEAANMLSLTPGEVNRLREQGVLHGYKDGSTWKFEQERVKTYLVEKTKAASSANAVQDGNGLLTDEDDAEGPTMLGLSTDDFDKMFEKSASDGFAPIVAKEDDAQKDDLSLAEEEDDLALAPDEGGLDFDFAKETEESNTEESNTEESNVVDELAVAPEDELVVVSENESDDLLLVKEDEPLTLSDEASALVEDEPVAATESSSAVDLAGETNASDDDLLHLGSDSGLSLLDDVDVGGSNVSLGDEEGDLVLGGSGSGSGSGLNLGSDSGLELLGDSDGDFSLDGDLAGAAEEEEADDDGIFELAPEPELESPVLDMGKDADSDAPTELASAEEGIFELAEDVNQATSDESSSDSNSASQLIDIDDSAANPFLTEVDDSSSSSLDAFAAPESEGESDLFKVDDSSSADSPFGAFGADDSSSSSPFGVAPDMPSDSAPSGLSFDKSDSSASDDSFGAVDFGAVDASEPVASASRALIASTNYTGKDLAFLVPCLIFLILATIGAYELCRTIWSYQEGSFDLTGPVLETIAKMVKLI